MFFVWYKCLKKYPTVVLAMLFTHVDVVVVLVDIVFIVAVVVDVCSNTKKTEIFPARTTRWCKHTKAPQPLCFVKSTRIHSTEW